MDVSTVMASLLTGKATKTIYRWVDDGLLPAQQAEGDWSGGKIGGKLLFSLADLRPHLAIPITPDLENALEDANEGKASGFNEVALLFAEAGHFDIALRWFEMAAKKGHADAMEWLATCYLEGLGTAPSTPHAIEWLGKAAAAGHLVALAKIDALLA
jgi:TPR repeat protein